jgi:drug/metabolite transporter (DMT)-like permease
MRIRFALPTHRFLWWWLGMGALWGSSYVFVKAGVKGFSPAAITCVRLAIAAPTLTAWAVVRTGPRKLWLAVHGAAGHLLVIALLNYWLAFFLLAWGQARVASNVAAVASSSIPIFIALLACFSPGTRTQPVQLIGVALGFLGIVILTGVHPGSTGSQAIGTVAVVGSALIYGVAYVYTARFLRGVPPLVVSASGTAMAFVIALPLGLASAPSSMPPLSAWIGTVANSLLITAAASVLTWSMIARFGPVRTGLVDYCSPLFAALYGFLLFAEPIRLTLLGALACILGGVALASRTGLRPASERSAIGSRQAGVPRPSLDD